MKEYFIQRFRDAITRPGSKELLEWLEKSAKGIPEDMLKRLAFMLRCETKDLMKGGKV